MRGHYESRVYITIIQTLKSERRCCARAPQIELLGNVHVQKPATWSLSSSFGWVHRFDSCFWGFTDGTGFEFLMSKSLCTERQAERHTKPEVDGLFLYFQYLCSSWPRMTKNRPPCGPPRCPSAEDLMPNYDSGIKPEIHTKYRTGDPTTGDGGDGGKWGWLGGLLITILLQFVGFFAQFKIGQIVCSHCSDITPISHL